MKKVAILRRRKLGYTSCREISARSTKGIQVVRNDREVPNDVDLVIRWGTTSNVPIQNVINTAKAIHAVNDKREFRKVLDEHELCPPTYFNYKGPSLGGLIPAVSGEEYDTYVTPMILRPSKHAQGRNVHVVRNTAEASSFARKYGEGNYYVSELINKVAEYRVFVAQGRVACVAEKTPGNPDDVAWNVAKGGRFDNVRWDNWPLKAVRKAVEAFNLSGLDFGGVDVMVDDEGEAYVIEINSAPSLTSPYRQQCMAKVFDYMIENGKESIPMKQERGGYRKFIHPAITDKAELV